eukprot:TRINITY_DN72375_c0_g1_i1.p1 TRINITY_DN72375_c0_g1~~TRINITY_DN72375_c0_g1_i1.p1  ORF type:complete len:245 (+),score=49.00 TRINITY_DN72375_c0_g1_i1:96-830(+)
MFSFACCASSAVGGTEIEIGCGDEHVQAHGKQVDATPVRGRSADLADAQWYCKVKAAKEAEESAKKNGQNSRALGDRKPSSASVNTLGEGRTALGDKQSSSASLHTLGGGRTGMGDKQPSSASVNTLCEEGISDTSTTADNSDVETTIVYPVTLQIGAKTRLGLKLFHGTNVVGTVFADGLVELYNRAATDDRRRVRVGDKLVNFDGCTEQDKIFEVMSSTMRTSAVGTVLSLQFSRTMKGFPA